MRGITIVSITVLCMSVTLYAADTRTVQADFDRCAQVMERVERSLRRYEDEISALQRTISRAAIEEKESASHELQALRSRLEYFRNRLERSRGQADRIRDDLKNVSGPSCPSCLVSSVNMYCRSGEMLQKDIDEHLGKAADLRTRLGMKTIDGAKGKSDFIEQKAAADTLYRALHGSADSCADKAAATLLEQARINLGRADSLHATGDNDGADKALGIARSLLDNAAQRCGAQE